MVVQSARKRGIPLYVHCCFRTEAEQRALFAKGASKVRYPNSAHNSAEAVDIVHGCYHWNLMPKEWAYIHALGRDALRRLNASLPYDKRLFLNWGGDDGSPGDSFRWDPAHWEVADYRKRIGPIAPGLPVHMSPTSILRLRG